ncbi:MAG: electron transport complex subunit RsxA [Planctomycetota bacterium]|nr:MAG: electron transport complex subunit RsxA [Planctomycetota bacterium]
MSGTEAFIIFFNVLLINNFVLAKFLGLCPFFGVSKRTGDALSMGAAVVFVMFMASLVTAFINWFFLLGHPGNLFYRAMGGDPAAYDMTFLYTIVYILVIAVLVQLVEMALMKLSPPIYRALGIYLPLITTNCAILGVALLNNDFAVEASGFWVYLAKCLIQGLGAGIGFTIAMLLMSGIRERLEYIPVPKPFRGIPISFIVAGIMALAFMGFASMI